MSARDVVEICEYIMWVSYIGPVKNIHLPKDKVTGMHQGYGFVEFKYEHDAEYAMKVMNMIKVYGKAIRVNKATQNGKVEDVGANIFIGENLRRIRNRL